MNVKSLKLSGNKGPEELGKEKQRATELVGTAEQQDMDIDLASEIPIPMDDTFPLAQASKESTKVENVKKQYISEKQRASLEKARKVRQEKAMRRRAGQDLGNAPEIQPDLIEDITERLHSKFERVEKMLEELQTKYAADSNNEALRNKQQVPSGKIKGEELNNQQVYTTKQQRLPEYVNVPKTEYQDTRDDYLDKDYMLYKSLNRRFPADMDMMIEDQPEAKKIKQRHHSNVFMF
jgi:hypothetical protein